MRGTKRARGAILNIFQRRSDVWISCGAADGQDYVGVTRVRTDMAATDRLRGKFSR